MKLKNIFFAAFIGIIALSGCDYITTPIIPKQKNNTLPTTPPSDTNSSKTPNVYKMLLEDCTGHLCSNCPLAEKDALIVLNSSIGNQVILMEDNMGFDAIPDTVGGAPDYAFSKDYRCVAGNNWCTLFNVNAVGYPYGMTNREGASGSTFVLYLNYVDSCTTIVGRTSQSVAIDIHDSCWTATANNPPIIGVEFEVTFKTAFPSSNSYLLEPVIIEDSIEDWQEDAAVTGGFDSTYIKRNTLRGSFDLTGVGTPIPTSYSSVAGSTFTSYQTYNFTTGENGKAAGWNMLHCYILAFVYNSPNNSQSPYQVVQAEMIKIAPHLYP